MITACICAWLAQRHVNVNGYSFNQTGVIKNKKYALLVKFHPEKNGVHAQTSLLPILQCNDSRYNRIPLYMY